MNLRSNFALTVAGLGAIASTGVLLFSKESNEAPAPEPQHRELTRHWFKKEVNPNGNKVWRRNKWSWYNGKKKEGRAYNYYYDRPGWTPNPNREINIQRRKARGGGRDPNRVLPGCSCTFNDNEGNTSPAVTPKIFGDAYICGACMVDSDGRDTYFKMAVLDVGGAQTASKYIGGVCSDDPANPGFTIADLDEDGYNTASPSASTAYPAQEADFSSCPAADETPPAVEDPNRGLCSCTFMDNQGNEYGAMTPAIFGDAYVCGGCQGTGDFKMVVLDSAGAAQPNGRYFPCPSENGATAEDLTLAQFEGARRTFTENPYSAPIVDFSGC